jgi:hypothetical protein
MAEETKPSKLSISFRKAPDYRLYPATGAWGGPTPDGQILMNIFVEHGALPSYQTFKVNDEGRVNLNEVLESAAAGDGERDVLCGIVLTPTNAKKIAEWLNNHADRILSKGE